MRIEAAGVAFVAVTFCAGCAPDKTLGPNGEHVTISATTATLYGNPGSEVTVEFVTTRQGTAVPMPGTPVQWQITQGFGAQLINAAPATDSKGVASARLVLGPMTGSYVVTATLTGGNKGTALARALLTPRITSIEPASANAGDLIMLYGSDFSDRSDENKVMIGGINAQILTAEPSVMRVVVPACATSGALTVQAQTGTLRSELATVQVSGSQAARVQIAVGQVKTMSEPSALACVRLANADYLVVVQNTAPKADSLLSLQVLGLADVTSAPTNATVTSTHRPTFDVQSQFEANMRAYERSAPRVSPNALQVMPRSVPLQVGDMRKFNAGWWYGDPVDVNATLRTISQRALIYVDATAADLFTDADLAKYADIFDKTIYPTDTGLWGAPSDIDGNGRVILLFSPEVNRATPADAPGVIAGFSTYCDLDNCSGSNQGEILYVMVPDPTGKWGKTVSNDFVAHNVPPLMAHEFTHVIHFHQRRTLVNRDEDIWLAEAMAHLSEDLNADVVERAGDMDMAAAFRRANYLRAALYLADPAATPVVWSSALGTLEARGASWLLLKYIVNRYGTNLLRNIAHTTLNGTVNLTTVTGASWTSLMNDWSVALYADHAPELANVGIDKNYTYAGSDLRSAIAGVMKDKMYPLQPAAGGSGDLRIGSLLSSGALQFIRVSAGDATNLVVTGGTGTRFPAASTIQVSIMRLK
jgi:uncharacterized protein (TIGR03437 family)